VQLLRAGLVLVRRPLHDGGVNDGDQLLALRILQGAEHRLRT
jgi:hypothetical protein